MVYGCLAGVIGVVYAEGEGGQLWPLVFMGGGFRETGSGSREGGKVLGLALPLKPPRLHPQPTIILLQSGSGAVCLMFQPWFIQAAHSPMTHVLRSHLPLIRQDFKFQPLN